MFVIFLIITGAHYFLYKFSFDRLNNYEVSKGLFVGSVIWTSVLLVAMWLRYTWARYVMITMICLSMAGFASLAMMVRSESVNPLPQLMKLVVYGAGLYAVALVPLSASVALRHFLGPKTAGER